MDLTGAVDEWDLLPLLRHERAQNEYNYYRSNVSAQLARSPPLISIYCRP